MFGGGDVAMTTRSYLFRHDVSAEVEPRGGIERNLEEAEGETSASCGP